MGRTRERRVKLLGHRMQEARTLGGGREHLLKLCVLGPVVIIALKAAFSGRQWLSIGSDFSFQGILGKVWTETLSVLCSKYLLVSIGQRPGILPNTLQRTGWPL